MRTRAAVAFEAKRPLEIVEVDLEGVNSPQRGWFKLGFAGDLRPYYELRWPGAATPQATQ